MQLKKDGSQRKSIKRSRAKIMNDVEIVTKLCGTIQTLNSIVMDQQILLGQLDATKEEIDDSERKRINAMKDVEKFI